jgi:hypothetical protein
MQRVDGPSDLKEFVGQASAAAAKITSAAEIPPLDA